MMTDPLQDPERWRQRAAEMRKIAEGIAHLPHAQASLLETAKEYDRRAARATKRHKNEIKPRTAGRPGLRLELSEEQSILKQKTDPGKPAEWAVFRRAHWDRRPQPRRP